MEKIKVLNLYAGIGGNRKLWENVDVTAVENNPKIAKAYKKFFPKDKVVVEDAHEYLLEHFEEFDFIWSSPPCPTHSRMRAMFKKMPTRKDKIPNLYPDMKLYQEIIFLKEWFKGKWVVENVKPYYEPLIRGQECHRHLFWSNFNIQKNKFLPNTLDIKTGKRDIGFDLNGIDVGHRKDQVLHNCVEPELGLHIFNSAYKSKQLTISGDLFTKKND